MSSEEQKETDTGVCFLYVHLAKAAESSWSELGKCPSFCHLPRWWEPSGQSVGYHPPGKVERGSRKKETEEWGLVEETWT